MTSLADLPLAARLAKAPYGAYAYSYPHKTAYRPLDPPAPLAPLWAAENREALFLYLHIPFCEMRCGFCNLFSLSIPEAELMTAYVDQLVRQMGVLADCLGDHGIARFALGGGTPTYLDAHHLERLLEAAQTRFSLTLADIGGSVEVSPDTATPEKLQLLGQAGLSRVSVGIQSTDPAEARALARRPPRDGVAATLERLRTHGPETLNVDLIYGIPGQTPASFGRTLAEVLPWRPEEIYLYPLYVRSLTGLGRIQVREQSAGGSRFPMNPDTMRQTLYGQGRETLLAAGYEQVSMRYFRLPAARKERGPAYSCQHDGMVGLGCGARSYTRSLHYATPYAVGRSATRAGIETYCAHPEAWFAAAHHGIELDEDEQQRRFVVQSLLTNPGLDLAAYGARFPGSDPWRDHPLLGALLAEGYARQETPETLALTDAGTALSDAIGPLFVSPTVAARMQAYGLR